MRGGGINDALIVDPCVGRVNWLCNARHFINAEMEVPACGEFGKHDNIGVDCCNVLNNTLRVGIEVAKRWGELDAGDAHQKVVVKLKIGVYGVPLSPSAVLLPADGRIGSARLKM